MVPKSIRRHLRCGDCLRVYLFLDERQQDHDAPVRGARVVEEEMGWQPRTAQKHLRHLADAGLIKLDPKPLPGGGWSDTRLIVVHNPARSRRATVRTMQRVWEKPKARWRNPSNLDSLTNARRDAPSIPDAEPGSADDNPEHDAISDDISERSASRATNGGASRYQTRRDAPSVRADPSCSHSLGRPERVDGVRKGGEGGGREVSEAAKDRDRRDQPQGSAAKTREPEPERSEGSGCLPGEGNGDERDANPHDQPYERGPSGLTLRDAVADDAEKRAVRLLLSHFPGSEVLDPTAEPMTASNPKGDAP
jgi:hypothetical protein